MDHQDYQRMRNYRELNQLFLQMELESAARELTRKIEKFQIMEDTISATLVQDLEPLQHRINLLLYQLKNRK